MNNLSQGRKDAKAAKCKPQRGVIAQPRLKAWVKKTWQINLAALKGRDTKRWRTAKGLFSGGGGYGCHALAGLETQNSGDRDPGLQPGL